MTGTAVSEPERPTFPPRLRGEAAAPGRPVLETAVARAVAGIDPGLVVWGPGGEAMDAAMVLAPEVRLAEAMPAAFALMLGLGDALGALAPPEVAVHYEWPGTIRVNGVPCGRVRAAAATADTEAEPDWLVIGVEIAFRPADRTDPGTHPDRTWLAEEGCADLTPAALIESWSRHSLVWLNTWEADGFSPIHRAWCERAWRMGEPLADGSGLFVGLDEHGNMLVKTATGTVLRPLTELLEDA